MASIDDKLSKMSFEIGNIVGCEVTNAKNELRGFINILTILIMFNTLLIIGMYVMYTNDNNGNCSNGNTVYNNEFKTIKTSDIDVNELFDKIN